MGEETTKDNATIIVMRDQITKTMFAHVALHKGAEDWILKRLKHDLDLLGYKKLILRYDTELWRRNHSRKRSGEGLAVKWVP